MSTNYHSTTYQFRVINKVTTILIAVLSYNGKYNVYVNGQVSKANNQLSV
ncbi:hypothetical protein H9L19_07645 [Weissella diestrammenae]|uniref:Uncharacterized protein n=1 Tax=Weissella diestrammenae TaxID=1162633 RepID=A0A7G9T553_9LACO|nr:hypothetical protein [Weissella diestrammenae]QNN75228.1 hypothetical protein H9L19_07645 [Weissella diestrammenae]